MRILYKKGDLFECEESIIAHGCNAKGVMGSGVAKIVREKFPNAYELYVREHKLYGLQLGEVYGFDGGGDGEYKHILNCITQQSYGHGVQVSYSAIASCMLRINYKHKGASIAMPKIGAGLGGGDWNRISQIIEECSTDFQPVVYEL